MHPATHPGEKADPVLLVVVAVRTVGNGRSSDSRLSKAVKQLQNGKSVICLHGCSCPCTMSTNIQLLNGKPAVVPGVQGGEVVGWWDGGSIEMVRIV